MKTWVVLVAVGVLLGFATSASAQVSASAFTTGYRYDGAHRPTGTISPDPDGSGPLRYGAVRNSYDAAGRLVKVETGALADWQPDTVAPVAWSGFTIFKVETTSYDAMGRKVKETVGPGPAGSPVTTLTQYGYDALGRLECAAVRMNPAAFASLPSSACTLGAQGSDGPDRITRNTYDAVDQLLLVQKAYGTPLQQNYASYAYSSTGKQVSVTDANGNLATMAYDGFDRLSQWTFPSKTSPGQVNAADYESYGYDPNGNRTSLRKRDGRTLTFTYDALDRMTSKVVPDGCAPIQVGACAPASATRDVYYGYDLKGHQTYARFDGASGEGVTNTYDAMGQLDSSTINMGGTSRKLGYQYDADGNRTRITHPDNGYLGYEYDGLDRLSVVREDGGAVLASVTYDAGGRRAGLGFANTATRYGYDGASRLASLSHDLVGTSADQSLGYSYNPASQIASRTSSNDAYAWTGAVGVNRVYAVNGLNQYTAAGPASFGYDANGNLTSDGSITFAYDVENRLVSATGAVNASLVYDPLGRLFQTSGNAGVTRFLHDGDALIGEYNSAGAMTERYVHGADAGADDPLIWYHYATKGYRRGLVTDHQGSVIAAVDMYGNPIAINSYDEYGIPGAGNTGRFQYTGQAWIPELGMYYYKARMYSPTLGRFLQTDPIGYKDQVNLYAYVGNDPVNRTDPTGTEGACFYGPSQCNNVSPSNVPSNLRAAVDFVTDFLPVIGDAKSTYQAYQDPTAVNIIVAAIGVVPGAGDVAAKAIRSLERGARTLEKRALQHDIKAAREAANPTVRPGMEGRSSQEVAKQQAVRQEHLGKEAAEFRKQAAEKRDLADRLRKKMNE